MALSKQQAPTKNLLAFLAEASRRGFHVGEHPAYGGVDKSVHRAGSWHGDGLAADINWRGAGSERAKLLTLIPLAEEYGLGLTFARDGRVGSAANHQHHLHVDVGEWSNYGQGPVRAHRATRTAPDSTSSPGKRRKPRRPATLRRGRRTGPRKLWQRILLASGYDIGPAGVDGDFGPATEAATEEWQRDRGLVPDGVVGPRTWARALLADEDGRLRRGDRGVHVELLQLIVKAVRDGVYGSGTQEATERVQRYLGVSPDSIVGPATTGGLVTEWT